MRGKSLAVACLLVGMCSPARAQQWAEKMFDSLSFDFGGVARASKVEHRFIFKNIYKEEVHVSSVRSSCGCTDVSVHNDHLKTYEQGEIVAILNTRAFVGQRSATITVTIDQPFYAEVQLRVSGYIRTDVVLDPSSVEFGSVDVGGKAEQRIAVAYAGRDDWKIEDVKNASPYLEAEVKETARGGGRVNYELIVRLKPQAPPGYFLEQLTLVTNDRREKEIPIDVEGRIASAISVTPSSLFLGVVAPGKQVTKQLVVRAAQPFKIVSVTCDDPAFAFKYPDDARALHMIPVTFTAGETEGKSTGKIRITTDLPDAAALECTAYAQVQSIDVARQDRTQATTAKTSFPGESK